MTERPILFSAPMVRAIRDDSKTQTRRMVRGTCNQLHQGKLLGEWSLSKGPAKWDGAKRPWQWMSKKALQVGDWYEEVQTAVDDHVSSPLRCPYGQPGDRLWVRETWGIGSRPCPFEGSREGIEYRADQELLEDGDDLDVYEVDTPDGVCLGDYRSGWHPSIHMPRWASRITLEVLGVRVERLQDISEADILAEGVRVPVSADDRPLIRITGKHPPVGFLRELEMVTFTDILRAEWASLWSETYGRDSWDANPWVWVVEFRRLP